MSMTRVRVCGISAVIASFTFFAAAGDVQKAYTLVEEGKAVSSIVLDSSLDATLTYAALELANTIEKITGARLPIKDAQDTDSYPIYLVMSGNQKAPLPDAVRKQSRQIKDDGFVLAADADGVYVVGLKARGVLYGAYEILKRYGDVRWIMPGPEGEYCPQKLTFSVPEQLTLVNPSFRLRRFNLVCGGAREDTFAWLMRNNMRITGERWRLGYGSEKYSPWSQAGGHVFSTLLPDTYFPEHPEYFGLYKGKRLPQCGEIKENPEEYRAGGQANQPCTSNPDTIRIMCEGLLKLIRQTPEAEAFCILNNDSGSWCECENCTRLDPPAERQRRLVSTRYWTLANQLVEAGKRVFPDIEFGVSAYQSFQEPPTGIQPDPRVTVDFCVHQRCYLHSIGDESCEINQRYRDILAKWRALGMPVSTYEYGNCLPQGEVRYLPLEKIMAMDLKYYNKKGNVGYCDEVAPFDPVYDAKSPFNKRTVTESWRSNWLAIYMKAYFMWNAEADYDAVFEDVGSKFYGKVWPQMRKYKTLLRETYENTDSHFIYGTPSSSLGKCLDDPDVHQELNRLLDEAIQRASDDPVLLKKVSKEKEYFQLSWEVMREEYVALQPGPVQVVRIGQTIPIDGNLGKPEWKLAAPTSGFKMFGKKNELANPQTSVKVLYDDENFYLGIEALDPTSERRDVAARREHDDAAIWKDENLIEIFLSPPAFGVQYAHLVVSQNGDSWDALTYAPGNSDLKYDTGAEIKTKILDGRWVAEIRIPFQTLGGKPKAGEIWKLNIARNFKLGGSSWSNGVFHGQDSHRSVNFE